LLLVFALASTTTVPGVPVAVYAAVDVGVSVVLVIYLVTAAAIVVIGTLLLPLL
jgi:hypothetical protein